MTGVPQPSADCVLVTRFNLPSAGVESMIRAQDGWLRNRIELFERYCVPSVQAQRDRAFHWIVYLDPQSPEWLLDRLRPHIDATRFHPVYRESVNPTQLVEDISGIVGERRAGDLITANLDNDDAVAADFVSRLRTVPRRPQGSVAIFFGNGLIRSSDALYLRRDDTNAFRGVRDPWDAPLTCWADWHIHLGRHMPVTVVDGPPAWLQVVHGQNVSNRVRGRLVAATAYRALFPGALDDLADPRPAQRARDLLVARPVRSARDGARATLKRVVLGALGKNGLDRLKFQVGRLRARVRRA